MRYLIIIFKYLFLKKDSLMKKNFFNIFFNILLFHKTIFCNYNACSTPLKNCKPQTKSICGRSCNANKTHIRLHEFFGPASPERTTQWLSFLSKKKTFFSAQIIPFYSETSHGHNLASMFMPYGKTQLVAAEISSEAYNTQKNDIFANFFGLQTSPLTPLLSNSNPCNSGIDQLTFESTLCFNARQRAGGIGFDFLQQTCNNWWLEIAFPLIQISNELTMNEYIINPGGNFSPNIPEGQVGTMTYAFQNKRLKFGKINNKRHQEWGVADIECIIGYNILYNQYNFLDFYIGTIIPTGNKPNPTYLFSSEIGNGKHCGIFIGSHAETMLYENEENHLIFTTDISSRYLFKNNQLRTLDLVGKPWSRYFWAYESPIKAPIHGNIKGFITSNELQAALNSLQPVGNFTTLCVDVQPGYSLDLRAALSIDHCSFHTEIGMNVYARQAEKLCLTSTWQEGPGIASLFDFLFDSDPNSGTSTGLTEDGYFPTASQITTIKNVTIGNVPVSDNILTPIGVTTIYIPIRESDLDLKSAAQNGALANAFFASIGHYSSDNRHFVSIGSAYEIGKHGCFADRWTIWGKASFSF
jgi:hypothetical protein